ncbi:T9SS type A sorting domain-containing protein [Rhodocytophaga rosea]|uniref:T9SS type A sorting domain-containing protein n=1 Tax=Rhodocytophaga rosea TaxID=2704465 RepID=A0A6C0GLB3_9BACT|nr:PQQ-dependent sugar dehydrogenase [Rhodocytophaga rosea]QHT68443.1 T9SS type A sorting domain-containing protein [Rhodocytophaga rosea]
MRKYLLLLFTCISFYHALQAQLVMKDAFPALTFPQPVELTGAGDGSNRLFVVSQTGVIYVMPNSASATSTVFLNMTNRVLTGGERGLLGLAFHPAYRQNGYFYVSYNRTPNSARVISRFKVSPTNPNVADPASELIVLTYPQPYSNHNGGKIAFGKDGYLYISTGDGGSSGDPNNYAQNLTVLLGKMLRIDINRTSPGLNYAIPADNPLIAVPGVRKEIYAYGLRNPWKFSVDPVTGLIVLGDVGQGQREEINVIIKGGNYGWRLKEGSLCYNPAPNTDCSSYTNLIPPVYEYDRTQGSSVTGGYVYRGKIPYLYGKYIYGDFGSGNIWVGSANFADSTISNNLLQKFPGQISSFGEDDQRELYVCNYSNGKIYKITDEATIISYLVSPANGATGITSPAYVANSVPGATSYTIELNTNATFTGTALVQTSASRIINFTNLALGQTYYARVKTNLSPNWGRTTTFTTGTAESYAYLASPSNGTTGVTSPAYVANSVPGATSYTIELNTNATFTGTALVQTSASRIINFTNLALGQTYYARVKTNLSPNWGRTTTFTTGTAESYAYLASPSNGTTGVTSPAYVANSVPGATSYTIELNTNATFTGTALVQTSASRIINFTNLALGQTYYARVKTNLSPNWGRTTSFTTAGSSIARIASEEEVVNQAYGYQHQRVYPNPFTGYINLQVDTQLEPVTIRIANLQGIVVYEATGAFSNEEIKLGETLPAGTYILQVFGDKKISTYRIVKVN